MDGIKVVMEWMAWSAWCAGNSLDKETAGQIIRTEAMPATYFSTKFDLQDEARPADLDLQIVT